uniref:Phosphatidylinositol-3,4,5-trisphosphate 3-phosphatase n=1 Tax=Strigamia maritima TaxID=126957 RepID=T1J3Y5_STRMM
MPIVKAHTKPTYKRFDTYVTPDFTDDLEKNNWNDNSVAIDVMGSKEKKDETDDEDDIDEDIEDPFSYDAHALHNTIDPVAVAEPLPTTCFGKFRLKLENVVEHFIFRLFGLILIVIDICILIVELVKIQDDNLEEQKPYEIVSLTFVCYFVLEVTLRIIALGANRFFRQWFNVIDFIVVFTAFIITLISAVIDLIDLSGIYKLFTAKKHVEKGARHMVSQNKRRYQEDGFDLDLTYVTDRVIAMSFPSAGKMSCYRNPIKEVARFFNTKHPDHYKVYNLCSERTYDDQYFHGRVERYLVDDHNVPLLEDMVRFARSVRTWLDSHPLNVIAVHCKGGKGRTGTMICIWLVESGLFESAGDSLDYFGFRRTDLNISNKFQGVETPSQSRYVGYYEDIKDKLNGQMPEERALKIKMLRITALAGLGKGDGSDFSCEIFIGRNNKIFECNFGLNKNCQTHYYNEADYLEVKLTNCPNLVGDVKMKEIFLEDMKKLPFYLWFYTSFIENGSLLIKRNDLDNPHKPKTWQWFREKFSIEIIFETTINEENVGNCQKQMDP